VKGLLFSAERNSDIPDLSFPALQTPRQVLQNPFRRSHSYGLPGSPHSPHLADVAQSSRKLPRLQNHPANKKNTTYRRTDTTRTLTLSSVNKRLIPGTPKKNRKPQHCHYSRKRQNRLQKPKSSRLRILQKIKTDQAHKIVRVLYSSCATKRSTKRETGTRSFELANKKGGGKKKPINLVSRCERERE
jgi:hypothetical protein